MSGFFVHFFSMKSLLGPDVLMKVLRKGILVPESEGKWWAAPGSWERWEGTLGGEERRKKPGITWEVGLN